MQNLDSRLRCVHYQRALTPVAYRVNNECQGGHMVKMGMGDEHMVNFDQLVNRQVAHASPRIDQDILIDEE
jgi:hypothetical protein